MTTENQMKEYMQGRSNLYNFFRVVFQKEVTVPFIDGLKLMETSGNETLDQYLAKIKGESTEVLCANSKSEYARLFLGMSSDPVSLFESVHMDEHHVLMGDQRDEVVFIYRTEGIDSADDFELPEDHLSAELAFMGYLCDKTIAAIESDDKNEEVRLIEVQQAFIANHLGKWVPLLVDELVKRTGPQKEFSDFYVVMTRVLNDFIESERDIA